MAIEPSVTIVVTRTVVSGREADFEAWAHDVAEAAPKFAGHLGLSLVRPRDGGRDYAIVFRFETEAHLQAWEESEERKMFVARVTPMTEHSHMQRMTGMETWFSVPGGGPMVPPPRWKMVIVSFAVAFPTIQVLNLTLGVWLKPLPTLLRGAAIGLSMVLFMTYVAMPNVTRLLASWLYRRT